METQLIRAVPRCQEAADKSNCVSGIMEIEVILKSIDGEKEEKKKHQQSKIQQSPASVGLYCFEGEKKIHLGALGHVIIQK